MEVNSLKHNFWQILNLAKSLLAKNEVLKAKLKEQGTIYNWNLTELTKTIDDLKYKNTLLQRKVNIDLDEEPTVIAKEYPLALEDFSHQESQEEVKNPKEPLMFDQTSHSSYEDPPSSNSSSPTSNRSA